MQRGVDDMKQRLNVGRCKDPPPLPFNPSTQGGWAEFLSVPLV